MAKKKAKSEKSCGLNVKCHLNKVIESGKKWLSDSGQMRHDTIRQAEEKADKGS